MRGTIGIHQRFGEYLFAHFDEFVALIVAAAIVKFGLGWLIVC